MVRESLNARRLFLAGVAVLVAACVVSDPDSGRRHRWWAGLGPVLPHDSFPGDCKLCHVGTQWNVLTADFHYDHLEETGVPLVGAHQQAQCLRCHNNRGPVDVFAAKGCVGCHEDVHQGDLGHDCTSCHQPFTWQPQGQVALHSRTRFPLSGVHVATACVRCHPGASVGNFVPTSVECVTCHREDLRRTNNPPHIPLGLVDRCDRCHMPTSWHQAEFR